MASGDTDESGAEGEGDNEEGEGDALVDADMTPEQLKEWRAEEAERRKEEKILQAQLIVERKAERLAAKIQKEQDAATFKKNKADKEKKRVVDDKVASFYTPSKSSRVPSQLLFPPISSFRVLGTRRPKCYNWAWY